MHSGPLSVFETTEETDPQNLDLARRLGQKIGRDFGDCDRSGTLSIVCLLIIVDVFFFKFNTATTPVMAQDIVAEP